MIHGAQNRVVSVTENGTLNLTCGYLYGNNFSQGSGGAIHVEGATTLKMEGGVISGNSATGTGRDGGGQPAGDG